MGMGRCASVDFFSVCSVKAGLVSCRCFVGCPRVRTQVVHLSSVLLTVYVALTWAVWCGFVENWKSQL